MGTELQREVSLVHRRQRAWTIGVTAIVAVSGLSALAAWLGAMAIPPPARSAVIVVETPAPPPVVVAAPPPEVAMASPPAAPAPAEVAASSVWADLGPCPPAVASGDRPVGTASVEPAADGSDDGESLVGAAVSAGRHGVLAVWTERSVSYSTDDGASFDDVLFGPGSVRSVAVDCHGRVYALRTSGGEAEADEEGAKATPRAPARTMLGVRAGSREAWRTIDFFADDGDRGPRLAAEAGVVALAGAVAGDDTDGLLAVSRDGGATWRFDPLEVGGSWEGLVAVAVDPRGMVRVLSRWGDCDAEHSTLTRFDPASGASSKTDLEPYFRSPAAIEGAGGWVYGVDAPCAGVCGWAGEGPAAEFQPPRADWRPSGDAEDEVTLVSDGRTVYALAGGELARLRHGRARRVAAGVAMERALAADGEGRILGVSAAGGLVRWSSRHGLRHLHGWSSR